jgi:hypothetical protein
VTPGSYGRCVAASASSCLTCLRSFYEDLPEAEESNGGDDRGRIVFTVRRRTFGSFTNDRRDDGRLALICKAALGAQQAMVSAEPETFFVPPFVAWRGWVGMWLDGTGLDWAEVRELLVESYCLCAPRALSRRVEEELLHL